MNLFLRLVVVVSIIEFLSYSCANPISPTGGPKDTIPPTLLESQPADQQLNFQGQSITLTFDEIVNADKLKQNLIITPTTEIEYKTLPKKYSVTLQFDQTFNDSTTYTFNFFDGITDITEKNPVENLIIAFSTGNYIDSLMLTGQVSDLLSGDLQEKITVGLYAISDTLDFEVNKPTYFSATNEEGNYFLQNIKSSKYRLFAFGDENRNVLFDAATESYAVYPDTIHMAKISGDTINLQTIQIDASELNMISARPSGKYFEIRYTKPITDYTYQNSDSIFLPTKLVDESKTLRFYDNKSFQDSLYTIVNVRDSLCNNQVDTLFIKYRESSRKSEQYAITLEPNNGTSVNLDTRYSIKFNKPTNLLNEDFLNVVYDTLFSFDYSPKSVSFNKHRMQLNFQLEIDQNAYTDSLNQLINAIIIDTTNIDTAKLILKNRLQKIDPSSFKLSILPNSFLSVELDSSQTIVNTYKFLKSTNFGTIRLNLSTEETNFIVQLMSKTSVISEQQNCEACVFTNLTPGAYWVRILIDSNKNGQWDIGNYRKNIPAEPIIHFKEETTLRANFDNQLDYSF
jgi:hypothetical protein